MNAVNSANGSLQDSAGSGSDTDSDEDPQRYYQPISSQPDDEADQQNQVSNNDDTDRYRFNCPNPDDHGDNHQSSRVDALTNAYTRFVENGISSIDLTGKEEEIEGEAQEQEEEERMRRESEEEAIRRAFIEDERRRNAPLAPENASRVMEVMRGVSFSGLVPEWVNQIPEDRWIERLRTMRQQQPPP